MVRCHPDRGGPPGRGLAGTFGSRVAALNVDVVVDLICFTPESAATLVEALRGSTGHLVHCGTIWSYGVSHKLPDA